MTNLRIFYDSQTFCNQMYGGISRYFYELHKRSQPYGIKTDLLTTVTNNYYLNSDPTLKTVNFFKNNEFKSKRQIILGVNTLLHLKKIYYHEYIFHPTYFNPYFLTVVPKRPFVLTIYDMTHELYPHILPKKDHTSKEKRRLAEMATKIIAISENTKNDIIRLFNIPENKIAVTYLSDSFEKLTGKPDRIFNFRYILYVGYRGTYKNFIFMINSLKNILKKNDDLHLVCTGGGAFTDEEKCLLKELNVIERCIQINASDQVLASLYQNAEVYIFPSLYEGFGIPVLEAFRCKCPVIASNNSSLAEIGKNAALLFKDTDANDLAEKVNEILTNRSLRDNLIIKGENEVKKYSWKKTAEETYKIYQTL